MPKVAIAASCDADVITITSLARPVRAVVRDDLGADELAVLFLERRLSWVAVADENQKIVGFASMSDLVAGATNPCVRDVMLPFVLPIDERSSIARVSALMATRGLHRLLLVSAEGEAIGLVHALDVLRWFARRHGAHVPDETKQSWRRLCDEH